MKIIKDNILIYFGDRRHDYRSFMSNPIDLQDEQIFIPRSKMIKMEQTAKDIIVEVNEAHAGFGFLDHTKEIAEADGIITQTKDIFLCVRTADCYPILLFDASSGVVAAVHSGREGTRLNICGKMIRKMIQDYQCNPYNIQIIIGAGISETHYEVDETCEKEFYDSLSYLKKIDPGFGIDKKARHLNLLKTIMLQISNEGIPVSQIQYIPHCTYENQRYFSYRREHGNNRQLSIIGIIK
jgi:YfiH family protein